ncbi:hypothetical protein G210_5135, partial [Candida maltosa Xu316]
TTFEPEATSDDTETTPVEATGEEDAESIHSSVVTADDSTTIILTALEPETIQAEGSEYTTTWTVTDEEGFEMICSGLATADDSTTITLITFPMESLTTDASSGTVDTTTWEANETNGSVITQYGSVHEEDEEFETSTTLVVATTTLYTTQFITTCPNGDITTTSGEVIVGTDSE